MSERPFNILFVCQHNSARSLMAEGVLRKWGMNRFNCYSAGSEPASAINAMAEDIMVKAKVPIDGLAPKSWDVFMAPGAPQMDFVFVVCDTCWEKGLPEFPGNPMIARWSFPDPTDLHGSEIERRALFNLVFGMIERRIKIFCALPDRRIARLTAKELSDIATGHEAAPAA